MTDLADDWPPPDEPEPREWRITLAHDVPKDIHRGRPVDFEINVDGGTADRIQGRVKFRRRNVIVIIENRT